MVRELRRRHNDRFSEYLSPEVLARFNEAISGHFPGIGLSVTPVKRGLRVSKVFPGSPARGAGIAVGDVIVSVDGDSIAGESSQASTEKIKGPEGTEVAVGLVRPPRAVRARQLRIERAQIALPVVSSRVETVAGRKLGHLRLLSFSEGAHALVHDAVRGSSSGTWRGGDRARPARQRRRAARGGRPDCERLLARGGGRGHDRFAHPGRGRLRDARRQPAGAVPIVVLIDRNTASAAEILAAALADNAGAEVVGTRSFGKGVFQQEIDLSNGGALKLTIGEYFTPDGVNLARSRGIHPDVKATDDPSTRAGRDARPRPRRPGKRAMSFRCAFCHLWLHKAHRKRRLGGGV